MHAMFSSLFIGRKEKAKLKQLININPAPNAWCREQREPKAPASNGRVFVFI
jgi:hypothetical protein